MGGDGREFLRPELGKARAKEGSIAVVKLVERTGTRLEEQKWQHAEGRACSKGDLREQRKERSFLGRAQLNACGCCYNTSIYET